MTTQDVPDKFSAEKATGITTKEIIPRNKQIFVP